LSASSFDSEKNGGSRIAAGTAMSLLVGSYCALISCGGSPHSKRSQLGDAVRVRRHLRIAQLRLGQRGLGERGLDAQHRLRVGGRLRGVLADELQRARDVRREVVAELLRLRVGACVVVALRQRDAALPELADRARRARRLGLRAVREERAAGSPVVVQLADKLEYGDLASAGRRLSRRRR
jgi:hypothetical protein